MNYPAYPEYEESGVAWMGRIPRHWQVMKLHHVTRMKSGSSITSLEMDDGEYPVFGGNGIRGRFSQYTHDGSYVLVGRQGAECGNVNYASGKFWASEHAVVSMPDRDLDYRWLGETLRAMNLNQYSQSAAQPGLSVEVIGRLKLPFPPLPEQRRIAAFLDWKTGQIDALIARKRELIEKLKEKRLAVITRAVTRGLNPDAPLRDSGVPWLGDVPEHWEVKRLKWAIMLQRGHDLPADQRVEGEVPVVSSSGISAYHDCAIANAPGIVTGRYGTIGVFHLIDRDYWPLNTTLYSNDIYGNSPRFLRAMLTNLAPLFLLNSVKSAVPGVDRNDVLSILVAIPDSTEQNAIADYLDRMADEIDRLVARVDVAIARLTEYRTALVTAATTGKIDVRNITVPTQPLSPP